MTGRQQAREIFQKALGQASVTAAFARHVQYDKGALRIGEDLFDINGFSRVFVAAFGKAAHTMAAELAAQIGGIGNGIIAAPAAALAGHAQLPNHRYFAAGHPTPNAESLRAAEAVLKSLRSLPANALAIFLVSGGGSSLLESPIDEAISLDDLRETYAALVHSGAPITAINAIRKHLSAVKGGRLAQAAMQGGGPVQQVSIMISDVPEGALDALASGPTMPDPSTADECYATIERYGLRERLPLSVREIIAARALAETPKKDDAAFRNARWWPILSNDTVVRAAVGQASAAGYAVEVDNSCDDMDYARAADDLLEKVRALRKGVSRACLISGGEVTVTLTGGAGTGGRNQQFALYCAGKIAGESITVLSAGTDGIDGNSEAAGAVVDGSTLARYSKLGLGRSVNDSLRAFDATPVLAALDDLVMTGPTGNNLRDLRILLAE